MRVIDRSRFAWESHHRLDECCPDVQVNQLYCRGPEDNASEEKQHNFRNMYDIRKFTEYRTYSKDVKQCEKGVSNT